MKNISIGIDIGGTNTVIGAVDDNAQILAEASISTQKFVILDDYISALVANIQEVLSKCGEYNLRGIGIGAPNGNFYSGAIDRAPNLPWKGKVMLAELLGRHFDCKIIVTNDAKAATIGEMVYGGAKGMKNFVMVTLGTGLGSGVVVNGSLVYGNDGFAGEFGHSVAIPGGRQCGCGRQGCLETYASATGIKRTAFEMMAKYNDPSKMRDIPFSKLTSKDIYIFATEGDTLALKAFDYTADILGRKLADLCTVLSPEAVFIFGGLANAKELIVDATKRYMEQYMLPIFRDKVKVMPSALLGTNIAVLGAAALVNA
ncbi:MAG: ROK family protein [Bacteroidales bacterium]|nr:ROK family protein [Bacteroidales bacterium]